MNFSRKPVTHRVTALFAVFVLTSILASAQQQDGSVKNLYYYQPSQKAERGEGEDLEL